MNCPLSRKGEERPFPHVRVRMDALYLSEDTRKLLLLDKVGIGNMKIGLGYLVLYHRTAIILNQFTMQNHPCSPIIRRPQWHLPKWPSHHLLWFSHIRVFQVRCQSIQNQQDIAYSPLQMLVSGRLCHIHYVQHALRM